MPNSKYLLFLCFFLIMSINTFYTFSNVFGFPSLVRQEINNVQHHEYNAKKKLSPFYDVVDGRYIPSTNRLNNLTKLQSVSYVSDGKFLNATLWLSKPFELFPVNDTPTYTVSIDADYDKFTGSNDGIDYEAEIIWNNKTNTWTYDLEEYSSILKGRVIEKIDNYTGFYTKEPVAGNDFNLNNRDVNIPINLDKIGPIVQGRILFSVGHELKLNNKDRRINDYSNWIPIPPPKFSIVLDPNNLIMRPRDNAKVSIQAYSNITDPPFPSIKLLNNTIQGITIKYPEIREIPLSQRGYTKFDISLVDNGHGHTGTYTLPIDLNALYNRYEKLTNSSLPTENITIRSAIAIKLLPELTTQDLLNNLLNNFPTWDQNFATFITLILSIIALGVAIKKFFSKDKKPA